MHRHSGGAEHHHDIYGNIVEGWHVGPTVTDKGPCAPARQD
jgi:hypothetical protein